MRRSTPPSVDVRAELPFWSGLWIYAASKLGVNQHKDMAKACTLVLVVHIIFLESVTALPQNYVVVPDRGSSPDSADNMNFTVDLSTADRQNCFRNMCFCINTTADCSKNQGKLPFVPKLPDNITFLDLSYNKVHEIPDDFFLNVTNITGLDLSHNGISGIRPGAFRPLEKLQTLILSYNHRLTYDILEPVFSLAGLKRLDLVHNKLGPLASDLFVKFPMAQLETLNLQGNDLQSALDLALFAPLQNLRALSLADNNLDNAVVPAILRTLEDLDLSQKGNVYFPITCNGNESFFPSLKSLSLVGTAGFDVPRHACLISLEILQFTVSSTIPTHAFTEDHFPALQKLYIYGVQRIEKDAFVTESLNLISFQSGSAAHFFSDGDLHDDSFRGCPNLSSLSFGGCGLQYVSDGKLQRLFSDVPNLKQLDLSGTVMKTLSVATFASLESLETLILAGNRFGFLESNVPDRVFDMMVNLTYLDLSNNFFFVARESMLSPHVRQNLRHLDLSGNFFWCSCELMWLRDWLISNPAVFSNPRSNYTCTVESSLFSLGPGKTIDISSFYLNKQACLLSQLAYLMIMLFVAQILVYFLCAVAFFRCRRTIKPMLYDIFRGQGNVGREHMRRQDYQYDVFVSYAAEDLPWVRAHLMPELEERQGLRLCIHDRDFRPGREIVGNITDKLEVSRKVMVIFSTEFARSPWCQFELTLCLTHVMDNADNMLVAYLHDIPPGEITNNMLAVLRTCTYLQWNDEEETRRRFWTRLLDALRAVIQDARRRVGHRPQEQPA